MNCNGSNMRREDLKAELKRSVIERLQTSVSMRCLSFILIAVNGIKYLGQFVK